MIALPSPLAGEGGRRSLTGEGSHSSEGSAQPLIRLPSGRHLLPQGEKGYILGDNDRFKVLP